MGIYANFIKDACENIVDAYGPSYDGSKHQHLLGMVDFCIDLPGCTLCWTIGPDGNAVVSVGDYGATKRRTWATCVFYALEKADPVIAVLDEEKFDAGLENLVQDVIGIIRQAAKWLY